MSLIGYQLSLEDPDFVNTWLWCFAVSARKGRRKWDYGSFFGYSWMQGNNASLHHGISHKPGRPDFWKKKSEQKKKDILKVKINLDLQMDTGSELTLMPKNIWKHIGKQTLWKSQFLLHQFDGSVIKTLGYFESSLELEDKFEVISKIVITCKNNHILLGNDVLYIISTKLFEEEKMER